MFFKRVSRGSLGDVFYGFCLVSGSSGGFPFVSFFAKVQFSLKTCRSELLVYSIPF